MPDWDYFRIDYLPEWFIKSQRLEIERLLIRSFASILNNKKNILTKELSIYTLVNNIIDK